MISDSLSLQKSLKLQASWGAVQYIVRSSACSHGVYGLEVERDHKNQISLFQVVVAIRKNKQELGTMGWGGPREDLSEVVTVE